MPQDASHISTQSPEVKLATEILGDLKALEERAAHFHLLAEQVNTEETACLKELGKQKRKVKELLKRKGKSKADGDDGSEDVERIIRKLQHLELQFPKPAHIILRLALGSHAPVSLKPMALRLQYKREYEEFKLRFGVIFILLSICGLFLTSSRVVDAMYGFSMLYYYCTCVLREHILLVNGSRIRTWWIGHHYLSIIISGVMLICPATPAYKAFRTPFFSFALYIAIVQFFQYRYQKSRLYTLVALDRARPMDTVAGDGFFTDSLQREFVLLIPLLVIGQVWQLWNAWVLFGLWQEQDREVWQIPASIALFAILGIGNMLTTVRTWGAKAGRGKKSKQDTNLPGSPPISPVESPRVAIASVVNRKFRGSEPQ